VVGGMFFSTFLTLLVVPVVYTLLARFTRASEKTAAQIAEENMNNSKELEKKLVTEGGMTK
jgi:hypothetical protein